MSARTEGKYAWTARIGDKGQLVIPKEARELFDINPGDTVLILGDIERGLAIVSNEELLHFTSAVFAAQLDTQDVEPD
ncbi:AbrB/MazE/SpoVT family DNA-binding domain-containing protein [Bifidobacterium mongoliense]|jgi:AbrB family looped-hinge helix DNA binding protein|uniref:AbrB/MazE/SpoVT family DNA-binding domain-containing protein n=1 Tax=Bifidobacterium TaxID=1678 RepID=UPI00068B1F8D|nr:AbrB/MazE/SpoVT family DNA-binding domain-containing protein [Bifidobacterium crudilactis]